MQIKTTMRCSHLPKWLSLISQQTASAGKDVEKGNPSELLMGMQTGTATVENSMEFPQKIKNGTAFWLSDSTAGNISRESQNTNSKELMTPMFIAALFTAAKW